MSGDDAMIRPHMLTDRYYWWRAFAKLRDRLGAPNHLEYHLETAVERVHTPRAGLSDPLRILCVMPRWDYGNPRRGYSYEENNFFHGLWAMGHELLRFDYPTLEASLGRARMNELLKEAVYRHRPDLVFFSLFDDEIFPQTVKWITSSGLAQTLNWFSDDHWRFESFSTKWAPAFDWAVTTSHEAFLRYRASGIGRPILSQWGFNPWLYYRANDLTKLYDVAFVGQPYGKRRNVIAELRRQGLRVDAFGYGWPAGKITQREMVQVFNRARINLNFSDASVPGRYQVKGRTFEIPGCGGFMLTEDAPHLSEYYEPGKEVVLFDGTDDLLAKVRHYLEREDERENVARQGHERSLAHHTWAHRFSYIFSKIGLKD